MFRGSHSVSIDAKGRVAIPASYRQALIDACGGRMVVTPHWDGFLLVYPQDRFQTLEQQLLSKGGFDTQVRAIQRFLIGNARDVEMDRQGRILLPANLRAHAELDTKSMLAGMGHAFELWSEAKWQAGQEDFGQALAAQAASGDMPQALQDVPL